jgi:hypothetical protein
MKKSTAKLSTISWGASTAHTFSSGQVLYMSSTLYCIGGQVQLNCLLHGTSEAQLPFIAWGTSTAQLSTSETSTAQLSTVAFGASTA